MDSKIVKLDDSALDGISGGSIMVNADCTTIGYNCDNQYKVLDFNSVCAYVNANGYNMTEQKMLENMVTLGYITYL